MSEKHRRFTDRELRSFKEKMDLGQGYARVREYMLYGPKKEEDWAEPGSLLLTKDGRIYAIADRAPLREPWKYIGVFTNGEGAVKRFAREQIACFLDVSSIEDSLQNYQPSRIVMRLVKGVMSGEAVYIRAARMLAVNPPLPLEVRWRKAKVVIAVAKAIAAAKKEHEAEEPMPRIEKLSFYRPRREKKVRKEGWERHKMSAEVLTEYIPPSKEEKEEWGERDKERLEDLWERSNALVKQGNFGLKSLELHSILANADHFSPDALYRYGLCLETNGSKAEALKAFLQAQALDPRKEGPWDDKVDELVEELGAHEWASSFSRKCERDSKFDASQSRSFYAKLRSLKKKLDKALKKGYSPEVEAIAREILRYHPGNAEVRVHLARAMLRQGRPSWEVMTELEQAVHAGGKAGPWYIAMRKYQRYLAERHTKVCEHCRKVQLMVARFLEEAGPKEEQSKEGLAI